VFDYGVYGISNFVDLDENYPGELEDYSCGERTYDLDNGYNHAGTDIFTWPNSWLKMDKNEVEIVAAAPGVIIGKSDGNYDKNCSFTGTWNAVYVEHTDGTVTWYGHMKSGSLTEKQVGESVEAGEFLGIVGSSGQSTGPHLHFEVHNALGQVVDPFLGTCSSVSESMWNAQKPYFDSKVNAVRTHNAAPNFKFDSCNETEEPNFSDAFLVGDLGIFATYYQDQQMGQTSLYTIKDAAGNVFQSWTASSSESHYASSYWYWNWTIGESVETGVWEFSVTYEGETYYHDFTVSDPTTTPMTVTLYYPYDNELVEPGDLFFKWLPLADADTYEIQIAADASFEDVVLTGNSITDSELDLEMAEGTYYWRVRAVNEHGTGNWSSVRNYIYGAATSSESETGEVPAFTHLKQNYPNPFNPTTTISWDLQETSFVSLKVFDVMGREIRVLAERNFQAGNHSLIFDAYNLPSGMYFYELKTPAFVESRRMILIK
jgi:hypothetical protein